MKTRQDAGIQSGVEFLKVERLRGIAIALEGATVRFDKGNRDENIRSRWVIDFHVRLLQGPNAGATGNLSLGWADSDGNKYASRERWFDALAADSIGPLLIDKGEKKTDWVDFVDYTGKDKLDPKAVAAVEHKGTKKIARKKTAPDDGVKEEDDLPF